MVRFEARIKELVENLPDLAVLVEPLLIVRRTLREQIGILHRRLLAIVRDDEVCRRLMTVPGVGPVVALTYRATVDVPARFPGRGGVWTNAFQISIRRDQPNPRDIKMRGRDDADDALRGGSDHAGAHREVVLAQGLRHQDRRHRGMKKAIGALARRLKLLHRWREEAEKAGRRIERIAVAFKAGRDGFWSGAGSSARHRGLRLHASSAAVSRQHRRAKTDRLDTELLKTLLSWLAATASSDHCKMVENPTMRDEDGKRPDSLIGERSRIVNGIKAALVRVGIRGFNLS
jgi:transposase